MGSRPRRRLEIAAGLGVILIVVVGLLLGYRAAILTAVGAFLAIGADLAFVGLLDGEDRG